MDQKYILTEMEYKHTIRTQCKIAGGSLRVHPYLK